MLWRKLFKELDKFQALMLPPLFNPFCFTHAIYLSIQSIQPLHPILSNLSNPSYLSNHPTFT